MDSAKQDFRSRIRRTRRESTPSSDWNLLVATPEFQNAKLVASYASYGEEPDTRSLNDIVIAEKKILLLPRMNPDRTLSWVKWDGKPGKLLRHRNHDEPIGDSYLGQIDLIIVPALAVDHRGNRLGQGGGSYDRALAGISAWKVALINDAELLSETLPIEEHDQSVNAAVTPTKIVRF